MDPDLSDGLENFPLIEGSALASQADERSKHFSRCRLAVFVTLILACALAVVLHVRWLGQWPQVSMPWEEAGLRGGAQDTWTLSRVGTVCGNSAEIRIGEYTWSQSLEACGLRCVGTVGCVGFGFQRSAHLHKDSACYIWSGRCRWQPDPAWDHYVLTANRMEPVVCDAPKRPLWVPGGKSCGFLNRCLNNNQPYTNLDDAWAVCSHLPRCDFVVRWPGDLYYLRRRSDPNSANGDTLIYSCEESTTTRTDTSTTGTATSTVTHVIKVTRDIGGFKVNHMKYEDLIKEKGLTQEVEDEIKRQIAEEYGVQEDDVHISLSQR